MKTELVAQEKARKAAKEAAEEGAEEDGQPAQIPAAETGSSRQLHGVPHSRGAVAMSVMSVARGGCVCLIFGSKLAKFPNMYFSYFHILYSECSLNYVV